MKYKLLLLLILVIAVAIRLPFFSHNGHEPDFGYFETWAEHASRLGVVGAYQPDSGAGIDYPPVYIYFLQVLGSAYRLQHDDFNSLILDNWIRVANILVDVMVGLLIFVAASKFWDPKAGVISATLFLFNPYTIYNSIIWGQIDNLIGLILVGSIAALAYSKRLPAAVSLVVGVLTKFQTVIFLPLSLVYALRNWQVNRLIKALVLGLVAALVVVMPFMLTNNLGLLVGVYEQANGRYPYVTLNAQNIWWFGADPNDFSAVRDDHPVLFSLTPKNLGLASFGIVYLIVLLGLWRVSAGPLPEWLRWRFGGKQRVVHPLLSKSSAERAPVATVVETPEQFQNIHELILAYFTVGLAFFTLSTQMHERYLYPVFVLLPFLVWRSKRWWLVYAGLTVTQLMGLMYVLPINEQARGLIYTGFPYVTYVFAALHIGILFGLIARWVRKLL